MGFAQSLANILDVKIIAPTRTVGVNADGSIQLYGGKWVTFEPIK